MRTLFALVTITCVVVWLVPVVRNWQEHRRARWHVNEARRLFSEEPGRWGPYSVPLEGVQFYISPDGFEMLPNNQSRLSPKGDQLPPDALYVFPPGEWATSTQEAMQLMDQVVKQHTAQRD